MSDKSCVTINPCVMCQPLGAVLAFRGVEGAMTLLHGSQGCSAYIRLHLCHHFREPLDVASSALNEKEAVYGGEKNLKKGLRHVIERYDPELIGVATTCLAETIADDVTGIIADFSSKHRPVSPIIYAASPSYIGSHVDGFTGATRSLVAALAKAGPKDERVAIFTSSSLSCADIRAIKNIFTAYDQGVIVLPDYSETLEAPFDGEAPAISGGGTKISDIVATANVARAFSMGAAGSGSPSAGDFLRDEFGVRHSELALPVGVRATDACLSQVGEISGLAMPDSMAAERGRLLDALVDSHRYTFGVRVAIIADPDLAVGLTSLVSEMGMAPVVVASGPEDTNLPERLADATAGLTCAPRVISSADLDEARAAIIDEDVQLIIGPSSAARISVEEDIPIIRVGFPVHDRVGAQRKLVVGYAGAIGMVDEIANTVLECAIKKPNIEKREYV